MRYYIIAGEASGDLHASNLIKELVQQDDRAVVRGWGGNLMREAGAEIVRHYKDTAVMGFVTVLMKLRKIKNNLRLCCEDIQQWQPDVVILVDYAGFNLRIARFAKSIGLKVFYYISPKVWAWNTGRVKTIKKYVDHMYTIFPFETEFYKKYNYDVTYVGNPLVDAVATRPYQEETFEEFIQENHLPDKPIIALVPGSRKQELKYVLPVMLKVIPLFERFQFIIAGAPSLTKADYAPYLKKNKVPILYGQTYRLIKQAKAALVTSGTATLETALLRTPQVVCYNGEGGRLSYYLFKLFVKVDYISLVNLIAKKKVVVELMMHHLKKYKLFTQLYRVIYSHVLKMQIQEEYDEVIRELGAPGSSKRAAQAMIQRLQKMSEG